ncbi:helix-turn-helix domain-containing protein [Ammoniphilus sp. 3BR4]|uniref:helix-turn-helix domain-containing protein n=1 Tax=Ammoniphilus sp. 3BR4 TaxID=3158265 RepID=UPI003467EC08
MAVSYAPLYSTLHDRGHKISDLRKAKIISSATLAKIGKNEMVSMDVIDKICTVLECDFKDVVEHRIDTRLKVQLDEAINAVKDEKEEANSHELTQR